MRARILLCAVAAVPLATTAFAQLRQVNPTRVPTPAASTAATAAPQPDASALRVDPALQREEARRLALLTAADRAKLPAVGKELFVRAEQPPARGVRPKPLEAHARDLALAAGFASSDTDSLAFLTLMEAAKIAREDWRAAQATAKAADAAKACKDRECVVQLKPTAEFDQRALDTVRDRTKDRLDSLSDLSQEQQQRMQTLMERMAKADRAASNVLQRVAATAGSIVPNLK